MTISAVVISLLIGLCLLMFGRKLFWLVGGAIGFVIGMSSAKYFLSGSSEVLMLVIAIAAGILGALLLVFLLRVAVWLAGFLAGGFILMNLVEKFGVETSALPWVAFIVGGIIGGLLVAVLFDWALIIVSSLTGAFLVTHSLELGNVSSFVLVVLLFVGGIIVQSRFKGKRKPQTVQPAPVESRESEKT